MLDWTVTLGDLFQGGALVVTVVLAWAKITRQMAILETKHTALEKRLTGIEGRTEKKLDQLASDMHEGFSEVHKRLDGVISNRK